VLAATRDNGAASMSVGQNFAHRDLLCAAVRLLVSSSAVILRRCDNRFWIILLWLFGIPLTTIAFLTMFFWAYGVDV
jgi:hypothetical protein